MTNALESNKKQWQRCLKICTWREVEWLIFRSVKPPEAECGGGLEQHSAYPKYPAQCLKVSKFYCCCLNLIWEFSCVKAGIQTSRCFPACQTLPHQDCQVHFHPRFWSCAGTGILIILERFFAGRYNKIMGMFLLLIDSNESSSQQLCWCLKKWQGGWGCWDCSGCDRWPFSYWGNGGNAWIVCIKCFGSWPTLHFQEDLRSPQSLSYSEDEREVMQS